MKISLRWVCDHLAVSWQTINVSELVQAFNTSVAEIESVEHYKLDISNYFLGQISSVTPDLISVNLPELSTTVQLSFRSDVTTDQSKYYLIKKHTKGYVWASHADVYSIKDGLLRAVTCNSLQVKDGSWRELIETEDYIFEVDNKSITHRPDMWGHRGIAREVAAILNVELFPESKFLVAGITEQLTQSEGTNLGELAPVIRVATDGCKRISAIYVADVANTPSSLAIATRLLRVESNFHNFIVDATNYVMLDWGHPMHAFDGDKIKGKPEVRKATPGEKLNLLEGSAIDLTERDIVIADDQTVVSLAGINGGIGSGITDQTSKLLLEAACFDAATIRLSSAHHKLRTDASARFEKSLDPVNTTKAVLRCLNLFKEHGISLNGLSELISVGHLPQPTVITISQKYIEDRLGVTLPTGFVTAALEKLEFKVEEIEKNPIEYRITVPTFRATKDVLIPEDIVEEVGRRFGYGHIPMELPHCNESHGISWFDQVVRMKEFLAYGLGLAEVYNYALFDNTFVHKLGFLVESPVILKNPLSEQRTMLVTSLIPHLLQSVEENSACHDSVGFFEWGTTWNKSVDTVLERQVLAGIWYDTKKTVDFYACKAQLNRFFVMIDLPVTWHNASSSTLWSSRYQIADLVYNGTVIGKAGTVSKALLHTLGGGDAFVFELDGDFLKKFKAVQHIFKPLAKYQATTLDVSVMVPLTTTVADLEKVVANAEPRIFNVVLQDMFKKDDWNDSKSITMRFSVRDEHTTLDKVAIDAIQARVHDALVAHGAQVRS